MEPSHQNNKETEPFSKMSSHLFKTVNKGGSQLNAPKNDQAYSFLEVKDRQPRPKTTQYVFNTVINIREMDPHSKHVESMKCQAPSRVIFPVRMSMGTEPQMYQNFQHNCPKAYADGLNRLKSDAEDDTDQTNVTKDSKSKQKGKKRRRRSLRGRHKKVKKQHPNESLSSNKIVGNVREKLQSQQQNSSKPQQNKHHVESAKFNLGYSKLNTNQDQQRKLSGLEARLKMKAELYMSSSSNQIFPISHQKEHSKFLGPNNSEISFKANGAFGFGSVFGSQLQHVQNLSNTSAQMVSVFRTPKIESVSQLDPLGINTLQGRNAVFPLDNVTDSLQHQNIPVKNTDLRRMLFLGKLIGDKSQVQIDLGNESLQITEIRKTEKNTLLGKRNAPCEINPPKCPTPKSDISETSHIPESAIIDLDSDDQTVNNFLEEIRVQKALTRRDRETDILHFEHNEFDANFYKDHLDQGIFNQHLLPIYQKRNLLPTGIPQPDNHTFSFLDTKDPKRTPQIKRILKQIDNCFWATKKFIDLDATTGDLNGEDFTFTWKGFLGGTRFFNERNVLRPCVVCGKYFSATGMGGHMSRVHNGLSKNYTYRKRNEGWRGSMKFRNRVLSNMETASKAAKADC